MKRRERQPKAVLLFGREVVSELLDSYTSLEAKAVLKYGRWYITLPHPMSIVYNPHRSEYYFSLVAKVREHLAGIEAQEKLTTFLEK
jgi:hypothetical protein